MKSGLVLLAICAFTAAMVAKERRALNPEEVRREARSDNTTVNNTTATNTSRVICEPQTPCGWTTYKMPLKIVEMTLTNTYCICGPGVVCQVNEDDTAVHAFIHRCRPPSEEHSEES